MLFINKGKRLDLNSYLKIDNNLHVSVFYYINRNLCWQLTGYKSHCQPVKSLLFMVGFRLVLTKYRDGIH